MYVKVQYVKYVCMCVYICMVRSGPHGDVLCM